MYEIPKEIEINDKKFKIRHDGDYRVILDCFNALNDDELSDKEKVLTSLIIFYADINGIEDLDKLGDIELAVSKMYDFFNCGEKESSGAKSNSKLIDWELDSQLISSAINKVANMEIRAIEYLHWWTFMGYYMAIGESPLSNIVGIRSKIAKGKKLEKHEKEFKQQNPQYFSFDTRTVEQKDAEELARQLWNNGK